MNNTIAIAAIVAAAVAGFVCGYIWRMMVSEKRQRTLW
jgi:hypothetical protein